MHVLSTCAVCSGELVVTQPGQTLHPSCQTSFPTGDPLLDAYLAAVEADDHVQADQLQAAIDAVDTRPLGPAAELYASWGWPVFPLQPGSKIPYERTRGFKDASTDPAQVRKWWQRAPASNIGLATGHRFDVVDVDWLTKDTLQPTGAQESWPELRDSGALPDVHGIATTARGGVHLFLLPTGGGNLAGFRPGLDYRGIGGYVVAPPSRDEHGRRYTWTARPSPVLTAHDSALVGAA